MKLTTEKLVDLIKLIVMEREATIDEAIRIVEEAARGNKECVAYVEESIVLAASR